MKPAYLLDTNHVGMAVDPASLVGQRIFEARLAGTRLGTCLPVLCEIEAGPPRPLEAVEAAIKAVEADVLKLLREVAG